MMCIVHESAKLLGLIFNELCRNVGSSNIISLVTVISILLVASQFLFLFLACFLSLVQSEIGLQYYSSAKKEEIRKL
jgi:hypothetical protein